MFDFEAELEYDLDELESAEDFLNYFEIEFDQKIVHVNRLHILQRYHDYLAQTNFPDDEEKRRAIYKAQLERAYDDFTKSDAISEKVFKVLKEAGQPQGFVSLDMVAK